MGEPVYVSKIIPETNTIVLGKRQDTLSTRFSVSRLNLIKLASMPTELQATVKIRYKDPGHPATIKKGQQSGTLEVSLHEPVSAVTPGQSAVFYDGNDVIGGGFIERPDF